jgi:undecaprenyl-diphosphatase
VSRRSIGAPLLGAGLAFVVFVIIAVAAAGGRLEAFDRSLLLALREPVTLAPLGPGWVELALRDVTALGGYTVLAVLTAGVFGFLWLVGKRAAAVLVVASTAGGMLASNVLKAAFDRDRPDLVSHIVAVSSASFPSGHAMLAATVYLTLGALCAQVQPERRVRRYLIASAATLAVLIGFSRVYLGVHWPSDVLAGWCAGAAWALLCSAVAESLQRRGLVEDDRPAG